MARYFGFAFSAAMLGSGTVAMEKRDLDVEEVKASIGEMVSCLNPSHKATIEAARERFDLEVEIPERPPRVALQSGDSVVIMQVRGLPRLTDRHEYTSEEISGASFHFVEIKVL